MIKVLKKMFDDTVVKILEEWEAPGPFWARFGPKFQDGPTSVLFGRVTVGYTAPKIMYVFLFRVAQGPHKNFGTILVRFWVPSEIYYKHIRMIS